MNLPPYSSENANMRQYWTKSRSNDSSTGIGIGTIVWPSDSTRSATRSSSVWVSASRGAPCTVSVTSPMRRRRAAGPSTRPTFGNRGTGRNRSAAARNTAVSRTERVSTPLEMRSSGASCIAFAEETPAE